MASLKHKAERAAFDVAITAALKHVDKGRGKAMCQLIDLVQKVLKDTWPDAAYDALRGQFGQQVDEVHEQDLRRGRSTTYQDGSLKPWL